MLASCSRLLIPCLLLLQASSVFAQLNSSQARKLILKVAGSNLPSSSVRVKNVSVVDATTIEANAEIETAFRLEEDSAGQSFVRDVRVAPDRWESVAAMAAALGTKPPSGRCDGLNQMSRRLSVPSQRRARCLLAELLGVALPSDAVRIKSISGLGLPFANASSTTVVATLQLAFRFVNDGSGGWRISAIRSGNSEWVNIAQFQGALDAVKRRNALADMETVAEALEKFKTARGFYVTADEHRVVVDHLSPKYLSRIIRIDPWNRPYEYDGEGGRFTLRSVGPDGKSNTTDDVVVSRP